MTTQPELALGDTASEVMPSPAPRSSPAPTAADIARDRAIDRVGKAHQAWVQLAIDTIRVVSIEKPEFTTDDLWDRLPMVSEPKAMGAALRSARQLGLIRPTGHYRKSVRKECHRRPILVWQRKVA